MSDGLKLISAAIAAGSNAAILRIDPTYFLENEREVADYVRGYLRQYRTLPQAATLREELGVNLPIAREPVEFYVNKVEDRHAYNHIRSHFSDLRESVSSGDVEAAITAARAMGRINRGGRHGRQVMDIGEAGEMVLERMRRVRGTGGMSGIATGWDGLDRITGGWQDSDLISLVGRPGLGKTFVLLRVAESAHRAGYSVLVVTTEMGCEPIARRYASLSLGINPTLLKSGEISTYTERRVRSLYREMVGRERFKIFSVGMDSKVSAIEALCQELMPDIVLIDGSYLLKPAHGRASQSKTERMSDVMDDLKALNIEAEVPIIQTTQFNRQAGKGGKEGSLETIGYTDAIGTHSSLVLALKYGPTENPMASRELEFLKGREGETGSIAFNFKFAPLDMNEFTPEQREEASADAVDPAILDWMA